MQYILCSLLFFMGAALLFLGSSRTPSGACANAVAKHRATGTSGVIDKWIARFAVRLLPYIRLSKDRSRSYGKMLAAANDKRSPETLMAEATVYIAIGVLLGLPLVFRSSLLPVLFGLLAWWQFWYRQVNGLKAGYRRYLSTIEMDLPKLCSVINSRLGSTKNVPDILASFLPIACPAMRDEISQTLFDMRTGNQKEALVNWEARLGSPRVSDIARGLIAVINGDDQRVYFQSKQQQLNSDYQNAKRKEIQERSLKLAVPELLLFLFFMVLVFYPLLTTVIASMKGFV